MRHASAFAAAALVAAAFVSAPLRAQETRPQVAPAASGASTRPLSPAATSAIDDVFREWDLPDVPGAAVGVYRGGRLVYARGYGVASLEHGAPITSRTVFDLASASKQFTAACIALLAIDGKLSLDDPLSRHLPDLPAWAAATTIRHCLYHTSGIRDYLALLMFAGVREQDVTDDDDALRALRRQRGLSFPAGARHEYSNSGYFLLSQVVKAASGRSLAAFAAERFFAPLGMTSTRFIDDCTAVVPRRAASYEPRGKGFAIVASDWQQTGDGGVLTTVEDLAAWVRNFSTGEVGGPRFLAMMGIRGATDDGRPLDYGFGLTFSDGANGTSISHSGAWAGFRTELVRLPAEDLAVAVLCNRGDADPSAKASQVVRAVRSHAAEFGLPPRPTSRVATPESKPARRPRAATASRPDLPALPLTAYAGEWYSDELDVVWTITAKPRLLGVACRGVPPLDVGAAGPDVFATLSGLKLTFRRDAEGRPTAFTVATRGVDGVEFVRRKP